MARFKVVEDLELTSPENEVSQHKVGEFLDLNEEQAAALGEKVVPAEGEEPAKTDEASEVKTGEDSEVKKEEQAS